MAPKRDYHEKCEGCNEYVAKGTNRGVQVSPQNCKCRDDGPLDDGPPALPRTVSWHSATLISADGKIKWLYNTIFLALEDDMWHHRDVIEKGKYYWLDETWGLGGEGCDSYDAAAQAQLEYGKRL